jgi:soluble lytic murein transglycosylase-like protein
MPATGASYGVTDATDPAQNIRGGVAHMASLWKKHKGNQRDVLAEYNGGAAAVDALNAAAARSAAEPVRKSVVLSESEQLKPETLVSGMVNEWLSTSTGKLVAVVVLFVLGFVVGRLF